MMDQPNFNEIAAQARLLGSLRSGAYVMRATAIQAGKTAILFERFAEAVAALMGDGQTFDDPEIIRGRRRRILVK